MAFSRFVVGTVALAACVQVAAAQTIPIAYCSTLNTATTNANFSTWQSEGLCAEFCRPSFAFAVVQAKSCWCSNYVPGSGTTSSGSCNDACPGFPGDWCGNEPRGLFGYLSLSSNPSGTRGAGAAQSTGRSAGQQATIIASPPRPTTVEITVVAPVPTAAESTSLMISSASPTTTGPASAAQSSSAWTPTPVVSVVTAGGGEIRTVTVTPSVQPTAAGQALDTSSANSGGGGLGTGGAVGLTIGLVALVAIIGAIIFCCLRRRRKARNAAAAAAYEEHTPVSSSGGAAPQRTMSENSRYMLGTDGRQVVEGWQDDDPSASRKSRLLPVDPRLDPFAPVYQRGDATKSRDSVNSIQDNHDYSRRMVGNGKGPLRAINPDS